MAKNGRYACINKRTVKDEDILAQGVFDQKHTHPAVKKMSIHVGAPCRVLINGLDEITIRPDLGLQLSYDDIQVETMVTKDGDIDFYAIVAY